MNDLTKLFETFRLAREELEAAGKARMEATQAECAARIRLDRARDAETAAWEALSKAREPLPKASRAKTVDSLYDRPA